MIANGERRSLWLSNPYRELKKAWPLAEANAPTLPRYGHERASPACLLVRMSLEIARGILDAWSREVDDLVRSLPFCTDEQHRRRTVDQIERLTKAGQLFARDILAWYGEDWAPRETWLRKPSVGV